MSFHILGSTTTLSTMIFSGVILAPAVAAQATVIPAVQDLQDLRTIINAAAEKIGASNNSGWFPLLGGSDQMGTADLVQNVTSSILRVNYNLEANRTTWLNQSNTTLPTLPLTGSILLPTESSGPTLSPVPLPSVTVSDITLSSPLTLTPLPSVSASIAPIDTLSIPSLGAAAIPPSFPTPPPLTNSLAPLPSSLTPTPGLVPDPAQENPVNITLDDQYIDYVSSLPNLSTALTTLGRSWHREMNKPVWDAIDALQQTINTFSSALLQAELIRSQAIIRTIRASSTLEDAQQAWSRFLNLPGSSKGTGSAGDSDSNSGGSIGGGLTGGLLGGGSTRRSLRRGVHRPVPINGFYRHKDLWGRGAKPEPGADAEARESQEGKSRPFDAVVAWEEHIGRAPRAFVA